MNHYLEMFIVKNFTKFGKALDLGAGNFRDVDALKEKGWTCDGVDKETRVDLNNLYLSDNRPYDLVYSHYVLHFLDNKQRLIDTAYQNLKHGGWFYLLTFDEADEVVHGFKPSEVESMLKHFEIKTTQLMDHYDDAPGHDHWHRILEFVCFKK